MNSSTHKVLGRSCIAMRRAAFGAVSAASLALAGAACAAIFATNPTGPPYTFATESDGTRFTVGASSIEVTRLGIWDEGGDGLNASFTVGIYRVSDQALLGSVVVPSGTAATLDSGTRWTDLGTPLTLTAGADYVVATRRADTSDTFHRADDPGQWTIAAGVTADNGVFAASDPGVLTYPNIPLANNGLLGPNFDFTPVPEPAGWAGIAAMLLPVVGALFHRHCRRLIRSSE